MSKILLLIDPQNDFCCPSGTLFVPGAPEDCLRIASFIAKQREYIDSIYITLDSHPVYHIAHPFFWKDAQGNTPPPFTEIRYTDYESGKFHPVDPSAVEKAGNYIRELESNGKYNLVLWPMHCLQGSIGMAVEKNVWQAVHEWECTRVAASASYIIKASSPYTEHYSALQAEVPDPDVPGTSLNTTFINTLKKADRIIIAGEALSHCVANTVRDMIRFVPPPIITLLTDCMSSVPGFEEAGQTFLTDMKAAGMQCCVSTELLLH